jgi:sorbitol-specific phosphotransferase system component IIBC
MEQAIQGLTTGTEGGRRPTGVPVEATTEVDPSSSRRRLTIAYKIRVVETVQALRSEGSGSIGAYLRREGLYYSAVRKWTQQFERGELTTRQNESKAKTRQLQAENQRLRRKLEQTEKKLKKTEMIVEIQKKLSSILGLDQAPNNEKDAEP